MADLVGLRRSPPRFVDLAPASWFRIHDARFRSTAFNPGAQANARFSTLTDAAGAVVPVLYAADSIEGALMETVFHEAPTPSAGAQLRCSEIAAKALVLSEVRATAVLRLVDLTSTGLRRIGLSRPQVTDIDTDAGAYPDTRALARHLHAACPSTHGLQWSSRQFDRSRAVMLFGDRIGPDCLVVKMPPRSLLDDDTEQRIMDLIDALGMRYLG